ncbi:type IV toxin-antitoxin system AbiEi family antitoxin domain-containing protein [Ornithinimicrobium tianjinense]|uniref:Transcriptional regulator, AbiEi antitoxin, Type IV TA system n=1 Tax=Ornithinimicrobium tianjinense TaxID=1195761 RepID=A0A917BJY4_9MICO|nr:type IV toxin-antitoxin system AbiEi family antitoxin domain-containing protein [Ornithinimicrobium tianjinense]GGF42622.1 hypothetical protein GCM10011366_08040 [Ornithinimicrobium tianjinense]
MTTPHVQSCVSTLLAAQHHVVTSDQLHGAGLTYENVVRLVDEGCLLRLRRSVYVDRDWWASSAPWDRHAVRARGYAMALGATAAAAAEETADAVDARRAPGRLALSHHSALALQGAGLYGVDDLVHLCRIDGGRGHRSSGLMMHAPVRPEHTVVVDGLRVVMPALACLQVAVLAGAEAGLVAADSLLRDGVVTREALTDARPHLKARAAGPVVDLVLALADGRRESAGESRTAWLAHQLGLPPLVPQVVISEDDGSFVARVDFVVEGTRVVVEFDGMMKYTDPGTLAAEKLREDRLRELGYEVVRITWADLARPETVRRRIQAALDRAAARAA